MYVHDRTITTPRRLRFWSLGAHKQEDIYIRHRYEAHRIVVRQGHVAESFYIVLSGTVMSNVRDGKTPVVQEIKEGGCFGVSCDVN